MRKEHGSGRIRLKDLSFGLSSAENEAAHSPDLLTKGFFDPMDLAQEAYEGRRFLFLGYKGSGKSALGEHIRLLAEADHRIFANTINISDISFTTFSQILKGQIEPDARYPIVWSWIFLLHLLDSFSRDEGSNVNESEELFYTLDSLRRIGLTPTPSLGQLISKTNESGFTFRLSGALGALELSRVPKAAPPELPFFADHLKSAVLQFKSPNRHFLIVDGFDELMRRGNLQWDALSCLIYEVNRLNQILLGTQCPAKIIVLCRTDLFERLPGANKNKIRQDSAIQITWYHNDSRPEDSALIGLINRRASLCAGAPPDVFDAFLPSTLNPHRPESIKHQLLDHTRHIPRDMVMLFGKLQEYSGDGPLSGSQVTNALAAYSRDYLLPEVLDEMSGYASEDDCQRIVVALGAMRVPIFSLDNLKKQISNLSFPSSFEPPSLLRVLFDRGAIGNVSHVNGKSHYTFKYRNRYSDFDPFQKIVIHRGLYKALNIRDISA